MDVTSHLYFLLTMLFISFLIMFPLSLLYNYIMYGNTFGNISSILTLNEPKNVCDIDCINLINKLCMYHKINR